MTARGEGEREALEALERLCRATCDQGPFEGAGVVTWEDGEPIWLACRGDGERLAGVRRELRRSRELRKRLEGGELARRDGYALMPAGGKTAFAVWHSPSVEPSRFVLARLGSLAQASLEVWRQQSLDRTLRRRLHHARRLLAHQEERTERAMRRAAHDLKAPLAAMKGYVDMMARGMAGPLTPTMQRYVERLRQAIERQRQLIDAELHAPPPSDEPPDLKQILQVALERSREAMETKAVGLDLVTPREPCRLRAPAAHLELLCRKLVRQMLRTATRGAVLEVELRENGKNWGLSLRVTGAALDVRGWSVCDAIAQRMGGSVDISWRGGMWLEVTLPRDGGAEATPRLVPSLEHQLT